MLQIKPFAELSLDELKQIAKTVQAELGSIEIVQKYKWTIPNYSKFVIENNDLMGLGIELIKSTKSFILIN